MPQATPTHVVERLLTLAVLEPTIGCRQYADRLGDQGFVIAKSPCKSTWSPTGWDGARSDWPEPPPSQRPRRDW